ncbi:MAG: acyltransferase [Flavobacteriales bacterium]|nr:acyltransferase [Flavobacteriales bacterium]
MRLIKTALYYLLAAKLPSSWWPGGAANNAFRLWCLRGICSVGKRTKVQRGVYIGKGDRIIIGDDCQINEMVRLDNARIGNNVMIARECVVLGKMHETTDTTKPMNQQGNKEVCQTVIHDDVWLGLRVIVMPGVEIAKGTIVGAGSVLTRSTEPYGVYGGIPARLIKYRKNGTNA